MINSFGNLFGKMMGPVPSGDIRLGMNGLPAINVNTGGTPQYKTYDYKTGTFTNCSEFAWDLDNSFFLVPATRVSPGDIIMGSGGPCCVIESGEKNLKVFSYKRGIIEELVPEQHIFLGNTYCFTKLFSPFANMLKGSKGMDNAVKWMVLSGMLSSSGKSAGAGPEMNPLLLMLAGGENGLLGDMFRGVFDAEDEKTKGDI